MPRFFSCPVCCCKYELDRINDHTYRLSAELQVRYCDAQLTHKSPLHSKRQASCTNRLGTKHKVGEHDVAAKKPEPQLGHVEIFEVGVENRVQIVGKPGSEQPTSHVLARSSLP